MEVKGSKNAKFFVRILPSNDFSYENIKVETNFKVSYYQIAFVISFLVCRIKIITRSNSNGVLFQGDLCKKLARYRSQLSGQH